MQIKRIRTKFLIVLLPLFIFSFVILSAISYYLASTYLTNSALTLASALGERFALDIRLQVSEKMNHLEDIAAAPPVKTMNEQTVVDRLAAEKKRRDGYTTLFFINLQDPAFNYGVTAEGKKFDYTTRSYTGHILKSQKSYVSEPNKSSSTGKLSVMLVTPIVNQEKMTGFLGGTVSLEALSELMKEVKFEQSGYGYIADNSGLIIAHHQNAGLVGTANIKETALGQSFQNVMNSGSQDVAYYTDAAGEDQTAILTPIELADSRWVMVITAPNREINAQAGNLAKIMTGISLLFLVVVIAIIYVFCRRIAKPMQIIRDECVVLNEGDLRERDIPVDSQDEVGQLAQGFVRMRNTIASLIKKTQAQAEHVAASSQELTASAQQSLEAVEHIADSVEKIAAGADDQSGAAKESAKTSKDMSAHAENISARAQNVNKVAQEAAGEVESGREEIAKVVLEMNKIDEGSKNVEESIGQLAVCSKEISSIVELISNIAGQTNLLALNAAIEAARAGEQGKGFAVVAEEVRKLAEESNQASQRIARLVEKNEKDMEEAIIATKSGSESVRLGMTAVNSADATFKNIVSAITRLSQEITDISAALHEMTAGCTAMMQKIGDIDQISRSNAADSQSVSAATEQQAASMREVAQASQGLARLAGELQAEVARFKV